MSSVAGNVSTKGSFQVNTSYNVLILFFRVITPWKHMVMRAQYLIGLTLEWSLLHGQMLWWWLFCLGLPGWILKHQVRIWPSDCLNIILIVHFKTNDRQFYSIFLFFLDFLIFLFQVVYLVSSMPLKACFGVVQLPQIWIFFVIILKAGTTDAFEIITLRF